MSRYAACLLGLFLCTSTAASGHENPSWSVEHLLAAQVISGPLRVSELATQATDSVRANMVAALAKGDIEAVILAWQINAGRQDIPKWLSSLRAAFLVANQRMGPCKEVARSIFEGFKQLGKEPVYLRFSTEGAHKTANLLAFEMRAGDPRSTIQVSDNSIHYVVRVGTRIYDAFTGPAGLELTEYLKRLVSPGTITYEMVSALP